MRSRCELTANISIWQRVEHRLGHKHMPSTHWFFQFKREDTAEWLWDQPHGGKFSAAAAWPGTLSPEPLGPENLVTGPRSLALCSAGMPKGKINRCGSTHITWETAELCDTTLDIKHMDLGYDPLLTNTVIAALTAPAESWLGTKDILRSSCSTEPLVDLNMCLKKLQHSRPWDTEEFFNGEHYEMCSYLPTFLFQMLGFSTVLKIYFRVILDCLWINFSKRRGYIPLTILHGVVLETQAFSLLSSEKVQFI